VKQKPGHTRRTDNGVNPNHISLAFVVFFCSVAGSAEPVTRRPENETHVLFVGDTYFGEVYQQARVRHGQENVLQTRGYADGLVNFVDLLQTTDLVVANLETPVTNRKRSPLTGRKNYLHRAIPKPTLDTLSAHNITVVSLANNHAGDDGSQALLETLHVLERTELNAFGAGRNSAEAERAFQRDLKVGSRTVRLLIAGGFEHRDNYDEQFNAYAGRATAGVARLSPQRTCAVFPSSDTGPPALRVVYPHWGQNYKWRSAKQQNVAHALVDAGADLVIGHGAHMFQEIEIYRDTLIVYSLGNFVFHADGRYAEKKAPPYGLIAQLRFASGTNRLTAGLRLDPIVTDNLRTGFRNRFVTDTEFEHASGLLALRTQGIDDHWRRGKDAHGHYLEFDLHWASPGQ